MKVRASRLRRAKEKAGSAEDLTFNEDSRDQKIEDL